MTLPPMRAERSVNLRSVTIPVARAAMRASLDAAATLAAIASVAGPRTMPRALRLWLVVLVGFFLMLMV